MFILFLISYLLWVGISTLLSNKVVPYLIAGKSFWVSQIQILVQTIFFFLFIYLVSGFFKPELVGIFLAGSELGLILNSIIVGFVGSLNTHWAAHAAWAGGEFGLKNKWIMLIFMTFSLLVVIIYPILIYKIPAEELLIGSVQYTSMLFISGYIILAPVLIGALKSENLDEDTRKRYLTAQLSGIIPAALYLSLFFWSLGSSQTGIALPHVAGISLTLSPALLLILFLFFFFITILPFLIGAIRAKKWKIQLLGKRNSFNEKILDILDYPVSSQYIPEIKDLFQQILDEINALPEDDIMIAYGHQIDKNIISKEIIPIEKPYQLARNMDPRFIYLDSLVDLANRTKQLIDDLTSASTDSELKEKVKAWKIPFHKAKHDLDKEIEAASQAKGPVMITSGISLIMLVISAILSDLGKWIFVQISK